jgi:hypothetical protein
MKRINLLFLSLFLLANVLANAQQEISRETVVSEQLSLENTFVLPTQKLVPATDAAILQSSNRKGIITVEDNAVIENSERIVFLSAPLISADQYQSNSIGRIVVEANDAKHEKQVQTVEIKAALIPAE